ncbi:hypothetical protein FRB90_009351 [Tulasnella sp. 427]|nr:hypothetical protein FRB90_009351 [Tulasnella sp. 427]
MALPSRRVSSANAVARIKRPATTTPTDDIRKPDLQLSHLFALERSSVKIHHLEPLTLGGYSPVPLSPLCTQNSRKGPQDFGEPKSGGEAPHSTIPPASSSPPHPTPSRPQQSLDHRRPSPRKHDTSSAHGLQEQTTSVLNTPVDEATEVPQARQRFFHHHLTESIRNRRVATAWHIYEAQKNRVRKDGRRGGRSVPTGLIHSLFALLAGAHPQTRLHYVRMKELAYVLRRRGHGNVREWEWNALINAAGRGFRKTTEADYRAAMEVLDEWEADVRLSKDLSHSSQDVAAADGSTFIGKSTPSIQTYNILVSIAARTGSRQLYQDALHRLQRFAGKLDAVSYLTRITHYREKGQLDQIPRLLERMLADGLPLHVDGANAIIWAYASNGHLETAQQIYKTMIPNTSSSPPPSFPSISHLSSASSTNPILCVPSILKAISALHPDHRTYIMLVQAYAQAGQLASALDTLQDYLATISEDKGAQGSSAKLGHIRAGDKQLTAAFRGIFLGFVKYGTAGTRYSSKRAFVGMSLKEAASALLMNLSSSTGQSEMSVPGVDTSHFNTETLLSLFRFYIVLTTSHISEANHPIPLPPPQFVRTVLLAFKNTALPETAAPLLNDVWATIVSQRLEPCGRKWLNQRDGWVWTKIRRDFGVDERREGAGMDS